MLPVTEISSHTKRSSKVVDDLYCQSCGTKKNVSFSHINYCGFLFCFYIDKHTQKKNDLFLRKKKYKRIALEINHEYSFVSR